MVDGRSGHFLGGCGLLLALLAIGGCHTSDLGTGLSTVTHRYPLSVEETWRTAKRSAQELELTLASDRHDALGGEFVALRATGEKVKVLLKAEDSRTTEVAVNVAPGDLDLATLFFQERMAGQAGLGKARMAIFDGESLEGVYVITLTECMDVARLAYRDLKVTVTHQESHSNWAAVDGRTADSTPVRVKSETITEMRTKVLFTVGTRKSDDNKALVRALKEDFEERLRLAKPQDP